MQLNASGSARRLAWPLFAVVLAVFTYFYHLDSLHAPKNGDEYPYEHITRLTAASGHFLPLQSHLDDMRDTKPPMLFWQGIVSTDWGRHWDLWHLRYPSVLYSLATALMVFLLAARLARDWRTGLVGALAYLAFFNTFRYGRPFLTNAPEVFWLFLPFFVLLYWKKTFESRLAVPALLGAGIGIGLLYKSFALLLPVGLGLAWWHLHWRRYDVRAFVRQDAAKLMLLALCALAVFSLWFLLDPDPLRVWNEFVVKENVGKFDPQGGSYLGKLLWGTSSMWSLALAFVSNTGLLAFPTVMLGVHAWRRRHELSDDEKLLWFWIITLYVVFCLPSQRSSRYLLAAMPAIAVLLALNWQRIGRKAFVLSLVSAGFVLAGMGYLAWRLQHELPALVLYTPRYWVLVAVTAALLLVGIFVARTTRAVTNVALLLLFLDLSVFLQPFDGVLGSYGAEAQNQVRGKVVRVPCNFRAKDEGHRFLLPGADVVGYREDKSLGVPELAARYPIFAVRLPLHTAPCDDCRVIGQRLEIRDRQSGAELKRMFLHGEVFENLFVNEFLIESRQALPNPAPIPADLGCR